MHPDELVNVYLSTPGIEDFEQGTLACLENAYQETWDHCLSGRYVQGHGRDVFPHQLKASFETSWIRFADESGFPTESCLNVARNCRYAKIRVGDIVFTACAVQKKSSQKLPRPSNFRKALASHNPDIYQGNLFEENIIDLDMYRSWHQHSPNDRIVYAILCHGYSRDRLPSIVQAIFPDSRYQNRLNAPIDLMRRHPGVIPVACSVEEQIPQAQPRLRNFSSYPEESTEEPKPSIKKFKTGEDQS